MTANSETPIVFFFFLSVNKREYCDRWKDGPLKTVHVLIPATC